MDSGIPDEGEPLDEEYDVTGPSTAEEVLGIMDQLLCLEVSVYLKLSHGGKPSLTPSADGLASRVPFVADDPDERPCGCPNESRTKNYRRCRFHERAL